MSTVTVTIALDGKLTINPPNSFLSFINVPGDPILKVSGVTEGTIIFEPEFGREYTAQQPCAAMWDGCRPTGAEIVLTRSGQTPDPDQLFTWAALSDNRVEVVFHVTKVPWVEHTRFAATVQQNGVEFPFIAFIDPKIYNDGT